MVSDPFRIAEAVRVGAALAAAFAGLTVSAVLRSLLRRGDGGAGRRSIAAMISASAAVATAALSFIVAARIGSRLDLVPVYLVSGFALGLLVGLFPRAAGLPLLVAAVLSTAIAAVGLSPWLEWSPDTEAARITAYRASGDESMIALRARASGGQTSERNIELGPGPVSLEFEVVDIQGPLSLAFGRRRYRPVAVSTLAAHVVLQGDRGPLVASGDGGVLAKALGCTLATLTTPPFESSVMASASYMMREDGAIDMIAR